MKNATITANVKKAIRINNFLRALAADMKDHLSGDIPMDADDMRHYTRNLADYTAQRELLSLKLTNEEKRVLASGAFAENDDYQTIEAARPGTSRPVNL